MTQPTQQDNQPLENTYDPSLVQDRASGMAAANAAQRARFAANPVTSGAPNAAPAAGYFGSEGAPAAPGPTGQGTPRWVTNPIGAVNALVRPSSTSAKSYVASGPTTQLDVGEKMQPLPANAPMSNITVMDSALNERQKGAGDAGGNTTSTGVTDPNQGPVTNAANAAPQLQAGERYPGQNTVTLAGQNVRGDVAAAQADQRVQDAISLSAAQAADAAGRPDYRQQQMDRSAARVANWHAEMDKYDVKGGIGNRRAAMEAAALSAANARDANARVALNDAANMRPVPGAQPRNLVQEEIAKQGAATTAEDKASEQINRGILAPAEAGLRTAQAGAEGAKTGLMGQELKSAQLNYHVQQHLSDLQQRASGTGADAESARTALALYQKAQSGKGGPLTDEDLLKVYGDMVSRATAMGGPDAYKTLPHFSDWKTMMTGQGTYTPPAGSTKGSYNGQTVYKLPSGKHVDANGKALD